MKIYRVWRSGLSASVLALALFPPMASAQTECEELRRECADYCRYGPVSPEKGRECKVECRRRVQDCQRGQRAAEGYPVFGERGGYGGGYAPGYGYGAPYGGAPYGGVPYGGVPYRAVPYGGASAPATAAPQAPAAAPRQRGPVGGRAPE
jgi:hypothetical protein